MPTIKITPRMFTALQYGLALYKERNASHINRASMEPVILESVKEVLPIYRKNIVDAETLSAMLKSLENSESITIEIVPES